MRCSASPTVPVAHVMDYDAIEVREQQMVDVLDPSTGAPRRSSSPPRR